MIVRKARREDAHAISAVHVKSWQEAYKGIINQNYLDQLKLEDRLPIWTTALETPKDNSLIYVAENAEQEIIGFASFGIERTKKFNADCELYAIYLIEEYKRSGVGTKLLERGVMDLLQAGYKSMLVWVLSENPSKEFYQSFSPDEAGTEEISIAGKKHQEIAFIWDDLLGLLEKIHVRTQR